MPKEVKEQSGSSKERFPKGPAKVERMNER